MSKEKGEKKPDDKAKAEISPEEEAAQSKKKKMLFLLIGGVGLLLGLGGGLFFFLSGGSQKKEHQQDHTQEETHGEHAEAPEAQHGEAKGEHGKKGDAHNAGGDHEKKEEGGKNEHGESNKGHETKNNQSKDGHGAAKEEHGAKKEGKNDGGGHGGGHDGGQGSATSGGEKKNNSKPSDTKLDGVDFGCTLPMTPFHLNLGNPLENRYIRLEVSIEYGCSEDQKAEIEKRLPQLRDAIISVTSRKTREFLLGPDGKEQLRKEIHNRINHYMTKKIDDVYITDILIE